jgi:N-acetyl-gamma-glutamyl-phosphate reductase
LQVAIQNVTGYAGLTTALLLQQHPEFHLVAVSGRSEAGKTVREVFPYWPGWEDLRIETEVPAVDLVFSALPHGAAAAAIEPLYRAGSKVVDISADFRLRDAEVYEHWYGRHPFPELLEEAVYGLPEWHRAALSQARLVGNPGCYPTASILTLGPALAAGIIEHEVIIDAKSGVSGAGRGLSLGTHFSEVNEAVAPYAVSGHRHTPEIEQELSLIAGKPVVALFMPHLVPMSRGMEVSCYARLRQPTTTPEVLDLYRRQYADEPFVRVVDGPPSSKWSSGANTCYIHAAVNRQGTHLMAFGVIDNLVKGAAGQAIQNANILCGLSESMGLMMPPIFP